MEEEYIIADTSYLRQHHGAACCYVENQSIELNLAACIYSSYQYFYSDIVRTELADVHYLAFIHTIHFPSLLFFNQLFTSLYLHALTKSQTS